MDLPQEIFVDAGNLKKGPWTSAEDAILVSYVSKHGEGNWNSVQKHSGLFRCGKSCRLRWANHLRPNLKKGAFSPDEERNIVELHSKLGNKWARMAAQVHPHLFFHSLCMPVLLLNIGHSSLCTSSSSLLLFLWHLCLVQKTHSCHSLLSLSRG
jgi:hypothetical protein